MVRVRFAPSPTGPLHIGGVRTALFNYLFAKKNNGKFILRIEDTDQSRFVKGAEEYICKSLDWCGISFDEGINEGGAYGPYRQSERKEIYHEYAQKLLNNGNAYIAFDTPEDLEKLRKDAELNGNTFVYNFESRVNLKNSLNLSKQEVESLLDKNTPYVIRFKIPENQIIEMNDIIRGNIKINTKELDDKVLQKTDGLPTYHLANIVDDHLMKISHVIRGEEWLPSLPLHVFLYKAFDWEAPEFAHLPLILKPTGKGKLSKRDGDSMGFPVFPIEWIDEKGEHFNSFKTQGYFPEAFINFLAMLGWNPGTEQEIFTIDELINSFSLDKVGKSGSRFDPDKTKWFNHQYMMAKTDKELAILLQEILNKKDIDDKSLNLELICNATKDRLYFINDIYTQSEFFFVTPTSYEEKFMKKAIKPDSNQILEDFLDFIGSIDEFKADVIEEESKKWLESKEIGIGKLMMPLRLALVGEGKGPNVFLIMEIIGLEETKTRIKNLTRL
jgi:glutamyl-tRNA synthetase